VHKISAYKYINENGKKKWENKKERVFLLAGSGGDFGPPGHERACASAAGGPAGPSVRETAGDGAVAQAHMPGRGRRADDAERATEGGVNRSARPPVVPATVLRPGSGSEAGERWRGTGRGRGSQGWGQFDRRGPRVDGPRRGGGCSRR
jgi:hypothetical protein